ncbi:MAG: transporter [Phycisphaeraceae bacterium]|nr:transporter [Phycisphaeraceae bacterium]
MRTNSLFLRSLPFLALALIAPAAVAAEEPIELRPLGPEPHPFTTERGRFAVEFTPVTYTFNRREPDGANVRSHSVDGHLLVKYGVLEHTEIQVGADFHVWERERDTDTGQVTTSSGFGDMTLRLKHNLVGNDGGDVAAAVMPFMELPTATGGVGASGIRGGVMAPTAWEFAEGWSLEWTPSLGAARNGDDDGYVFAFQSTVTLVGELHDGIDAFVEFESIVTSERGDPWVGLIGIGLTFELDENTVIEPAIHFGVTRSADDFAVSLSIVRRF